MKLEEKYQMGCQNGNFDKVVMDSDAISYHRHNFCTGAMRSRQGFRATSFFGDSGSRQNRWLRWAPALKAWSKFETK